MSASHRWTVFPAHGNVLPCTEQDFCVADASDILHIYEIRCMGPHKKHRIQTLRKFLKLSVERDRFLPSVERDPAQMGFKINNLLKRNLILYPVHMEMKQFSSVCDIVHCIRKCSVKDLFIDRFRDKAIGQCLEDLVYILFIVRDIDDQSVGSLSRIAAAVSIPEMPGMEISMR